jgi:hypothetical protein
MGAKIEIQSLNFNEIKPNYNLSYFLKKDFA